MTQEYIGTKQVTAWEQLGGPKVRICGRDCKQGDENCNGYCVGKEPYAPVVAQTPGYAVKYADGYTSWSPKEVFEEAYLPMGHITHLPPFVQRMVGEKVQLDDRIAKLSAFLGNSGSLDRLTVDEIGALKRQLDAMNLYSSILAERLAPWTEPDGA